MARMLFKSERNIFIGKKFFVIKGGGFNPLLRKISQDECTFIPMWFFKQNKLCRMGCVTYKTIEPIGDKCFIQDIPECSNWARVCINHELKVVKDLYKVSELEGVGRDTIQLNSLCRWVTDKYIAVGRNKVQLSVTIDGKEGLGKRSDWVKEFTNKS